MTLLESAHKDCANTIHSYAILCYKCPYDYHARYYRAQFVMITSYSDTRMHIRFRLHSPLTADPGQGHSQSDVITVQRHETFAAVQCPAAPRLAAEGLLLRSQIVRDIDTQISECLIQHLWNLLEPVGIRKLAGPAHHILTFGVNYPKVPPSRLLEAGSPPPHRSIIRATRAVPLQAAVGTGYSRRKRLTQFQVLPC